MKETILYTTFSNIDEAKKIANILLKDKLAACVNIFPGGESMYNWQGKVEHSIEVYAFIKTHQTLIQKIEDVYKKNHSYDTPCLAELGEVKFNQKYHEWLNDELIKKG
jgi:periplasmic divalent cation tolerance protein